MMFWRKKEPRDNASDLTAVIDAILSEKFTAEEAAGKLKPFLIRTVSLGDLDRLALEISNQGRSAGALRLAEANMLLAHGQEDETYKVQCACTLAQLISNDRQRIEERWHLLEYAVPEVLNWDIPAESKGAMLAHLADARFNFSNTEPSLNAGVVEAFEQALMYKDHIHPALLGRLYYIAGTRLEEMGDDEGTLLYAIECLETALQYYTVRDYPDEYASTLNNLGNSYRHLGIIKNDRLLLEKAIQTYDESLPYRETPQLKVRTQNNRRQAVELLEKLAGHQPLSRVTETAEEQRIRNLIRVGDDSLYESRQGKADSQQDLETAVKYYLEASRLIGRKSSPALKAEMQHRFASLFLDAVEDDPLWTGYCFANATRRLAQGHWKEVSQARILMHQGKILTKIGFPDHEHYLSHAEELLRRSLPIMEAQGHSGEADEAREYLGMCLSLMSAGGNAVHAKRAQQFYAEEESARLENLNPAITSAVASREKYDRYLQLVKKLAPEERNLALGALRAESTASIADQHVDEFIHAQKLIEVARKYLALGELAGALDVIKIAEEYAATARFSAPSIWCELATLYASIPLKDHARRCLDTAQSKMGLSVAEDVAVLPGDESGRWIPEYDLETYQEEINQTRREIEAAAAVPFDPAHTAQLLCPEDAARRLTIQAELETYLKQSSG